MLPNITQRIQDYDPLYLPSHFHTASYCLENPFDISWKKNIIENNQNEKIKFLNPKSLLHPLQTLNINCMLKRSNFVWLFEA